MRSRRLIAVISGVCLALAGCSGRSSSASSAGSAADGGAGTAQRVVPVPAPLPLGKATLDEFGYRRGPGRADYARAVRAEKAARDDADWAAVVDACRAARAADAAHLDAAWLEAAALARAGRHDEILEPLSTAVAGDWAKWGERSLALPLFGDFLASPHGEAWRELADRYRAEFARAARRAVVVLGRDGVPRGKDLDRRTELYGWDPETQRWLRLSRTGGTVVAALPGPADRGLVAYVAYRDLTRRVDRRAALERPRIAVVELASGRVSREIAFDDVVELRVAWRAGTGTDDPALVVAVDGKRADGAWLLDWKRGHKTQPAKKIALGKDQLIVARGQVRRRRLPAGVTADWDDGGLASAIRLDASRKTVAPPPGLLVDGHGVAWSPDRGRLAMVALPEGDCEAPARLFVVDVGTGRLRPVAEAAAPAPIWVDDTRLAYTDGDRVRIVDAMSAAPLAELTSTGGVATAILDRACSPPGTEAYFAVTDEPEPEPEEPSVEAADAGP